MDEIKRFWKRFEQVQDLWDRARTVFPVRRNMASLKARHERGDKSVVCYLDEDENPERYELKFSAKQREELYAAYRELKPADGPNDCEDRIFVGILERWGDSFLDSQAIQIPEQKKRKRAIASFGNALQKADQALADLDSAALGWLYANIVDDFAAHGVQVSSDDNELTSMCTVPLRAAVEAGELRLQLRELIRAAVDAAAKASATLPPPDRTANDPRLTIAKSLERQIIERGIAFTTTETGFPARCLRAVFELGGVETEKVSYWLKKAADDPHSFARVRERMMLDKTGGKNPPPV